MLFLWQQQMETAEKIIQEIERGDFKSLARAVTIVENDLPGTDALLKTLKHQQALVIGITGVPGAGKSTLCNAMVKHFLNENKKVAVIAVDPSSPFNYGSLMGDRLRLSEHFNNENVFIRSMASRGNLGGLSEKIIEVTDVMRSSVFDIIMIETVGVGQSEVEIAGLADITVVVLVPEAGDEIQMMKAGIMEVGDVFVVNKADRPGADIFAANLQQSLKEKSIHDMNIPVIKTVAAGNEGVKMLCDTILQIEKSPLLNDKKAALLTEKALRIISKRRMKDVDKNALKQKITALFNTSNFNLYSIADSF